MKYWAKLDSDNYIVSVTNGDSPGGEWVELPPGQPYSLTLRKRKFVNGQVVETNETWEPAPANDLKRARAYPKIGDQLDMLWHAMDTGQIPKAQQFYNALKAVKDKHPKGGQ